MVVDGIRRAPVWLFALAACRFSSAGAGGTGDASDTIGGTTNASADDAASTAGSTTSAVEGSGDTAVASTAADTTAASDPATTDASASTTDAEGGTTESTPTACERVLMVSNDTDPPSGADQPYYERLIALGIAVTLVPSGTAQASDVDDECLLVISSTVSAIDLENEFRDATVPIVTWESAAYADLRLVDPASPGASGVVEPADDVDVVLPAHPLAAGLAGTVTVFEGGGRIGWGMPTGDAQVVATVVGDATRASLFAFEAGATMGGGFVAPARRVAFPGGTTAATITPDALALFDAAIAWADG